MLGLAVVTSNACGGPSRRRLSSRPASTCSRWRPVVFERIVRPGCIRFSICGPAPAVTSSHQATSLAQEVGEGLGAQAGEKKLAEMLTGAGFTRVRRATEGPFNMVLEARP
jgi:hypothetical protein